MVAAHIILENTWFDSMKAKAIQDRCPGSVSAQWYNFHFVYFFYFRDHRRLLVGDYHGRIYSWSVPEAHGKTRVCCVL